MRMFVKSLLMLISWFCACPAGPIRKSVYELYAENYVLGASQGKEHGQSYVREKRGTNCEEGEESCPEMDSSGATVCVKHCQKCDGVVDCPNASDEVNCQCRIKLRTDLLCNGEIDCTDMSDELGCAPCRSHEFRCGDAGGSPRCVTTTDFCAGIPCEPFQWQLLCNRLSMKHSDSSETLFYRSKGFLQTFVGGRWLPMCGVRGEGLRRLTNAYCASLTEIEDGDNKIELRGVHGQHDGPWAVLAEVESRGPIFVGNSTSCNTNLVTFVDCDPPPCQRTPTNEGSPGIGIHGLVVGGVDATPSKWKFLVSIRKEGSHHCGGTIITSRWVFSAAHCFLKVTDEYFEVFTSLWQDSPIAPYVQVSLASHVIRHPRFDPYTMNDDAALVRLQTPFMFNQWVAPTCFNISLSVSSIQLCTLAGWGNLYENGELSPTLQEVSVPILGDKKCVSAFDFINTEKAFCAGYEQGGKDSCQGDSGGPIMCHECDPNDPLSCISGPWNQVGIVSYGSGCARPGTPGVYTKIKYFYDWMINTTASFDKNPQSLPDAVPSSSCRGFRCTNGYCIPKELVCDRKIDCHDALDEANCQSQGNASSITSGDFPARTEKSVTNPPPTNVTTQTETSINCQDLLGCNISGQCIAVEHVCDELRNCKDGTDEIGCYCVDYLSVQHPERICDGVRDCFDFSDEFCHPCEVGEWFCHTSVQCIDINKLCDNNVDCFLGDDESSCIALAPSSEGILKLDGEQIPLPSSKGHIIIYTTEDNEWNPICNEFDDRLYSDVCFFLGYDYVYGSYSRNDAPIKYTTEVLAERAKRSISSEEETGPKISNVHSELRKRIFSTSSDAARLNRTKIVDFKRREAAISNRTEDKTNFPYDYTYNKTDRNKREATCSQIYLSCGEKFCGKIPYLHFSSISPTGDRGIITWAVSVYVSGEYKCGGTIIENQWILTSALCFGHVSLLETNVFVLVGSNRENTQPRIFGPREVDIRVDAVLSVGDDWDLVLLHTTESIHDYHYLNSVCWNKNIPLSELEECVITGIFKDRLTHPLQLIPNSKNGCPPGQICFDQYFTHPGMCISEWSGLISCRQRFEDSSTWTAVGVWTFEAKGDGCYVPSRSHKLIDDELRRRITSLIGSSDLELYPEVPCHDHKCPLGICVPNSDICDGKISCPDLSDEPMNCPPLARPCQSLQGDLCVCEKGFVNCSSKFCIEESRICDGTPDCPSGEDEETCQCSMLFEDSASSIPCDGKIDCKDGSDEVECGCANDQYRCFRNGDNTCIPLRKLCDLETDCEGEEDEDYCITISNTAFAEEDALRRPILSQSNGYLLVRSNGKWLTFDDANWTVDYSDHVCKTLLNQKSLMTSRRNINIAEVVKRKGAITVALYRGEEFGIEVLPALYIECVA